VIQFLVVILLAKTPESRRYDPGPQVDPGKKLKLAFGLATDDYGISRHMWSS